jgi:arabinose-5-phosphate isomerase
MNSALAFELPKALEAHEPPEARGLARDEVRLMVASRHDGAIAHATFRDLPKFLRAGDLLVINTSATLPAAVPARRSDGEAVELRNILTYSRRFKVPLIAITSRADSTLAKQSDVVLELPRTKEACPHGLAPTTSTTMQVAIGDCLAIALLEHKGFTAQDFKIFHPGGSLGASLQFVSDIMRTGDSQPLVPEGKVMTEANVTMTEKSLGCRGVVDAEGRLIGMITDGDLRRHMGPGLLLARVEEIMTRDPKTLPPGTLASAALEQINSLKRGDASRPPGVTQMFVVENGKPVGIVHVHDLLRAGVA